jgi:hypothetical protein
MPKTITGYDIIIHWSDGTKEDLDNYGALPYFKNVDNYLDTIEEEVNQNEDEEDEEEEVAND